MLTPIDYCGESLAGSYWTEKLDGIRFEWDGESLTSRSGLLVDAPRELLQRFPQRMPLSGELWCGRGHFEEALSIYQSHASDPRWARLEPVAFDVPGCAGTLTEKRRLLGLLQNLRVVTFSPVREGFDAHAEAKRIAGEGGEGLVLRDTDGESAWRIKPRSEAEAVVLAQNSAMSVCCQMESGATFNLATPRGRPDVGAVVTYSYRGFTRHGKPREAAFKCIRNYEGDTHVKIQTLQRWSSDNATGGESADGLRHAPARGDRGIRDGSRVARRDNSQQADGGGDHKSCSTVAHVVTPHFRYSLSVG